MNWPRPWSRRRAPQRPAARLTFRPRLEALEDRQLLNSSSVLDANGQRFQLVVDTNNVLTEYTPTFALPLAQNVLRAHLYRDLNGGVGTIVIYTNFAAFDYDYAGGHFLGTNIVEADKAYDRGGHIRFDITYSQGANFVTIDYSLTTAGVISVPGQIAVLMHPFQDAQGNIGVEVSYFDTVTTCKLIEYDSAGARFLADNAVSDKTTDVSGRATTSFIQDVTYISNQAFEYSDTSALFLGDFIGI
jgi:hypothetical protein